MKLINPYELLFQKSNPMKLDRRVMVSPGLKTGDLQETNSTDGMGTL